MKFIYLLIGLSLCIHDDLGAQEGLSLATDIGVIRNFKDGQKYNAFGQGMHAQVHLNGRDAVYGMFAYYTPGTIKTNIVALARDPLTSPQQTSLVNTGKLGMKTISLGYKRWLAGGASIETGWGAYVLAGTGLLFGKVENTFSSLVDTAAYTVPIKPGIGRFRRITLDLGAGVDRPIGADIFLYAEARSYIPVSDYPSPYLPEGKYAPLTASLCVGIRIRF